MNYLQNLKPINVNDKIVKISFKIEKSTASIKVEPSEIFDVLVMYHADRKLVARKPNADTHESSKTLSFNKIETVTYNNLVESGECFVLNELENVHNAIEMIKTSVLAYACKNRNYLDDKLKEQEDLINYIMNL